MREKMKKRSKRCLEEIKIGSELNCKISYYSIYQGNCYKCNQCSLKVVIKGYLKHHVESIHQGNMKGNCYIIPPN